MSPMERRLQKIEAVVMPKPAQAITILVEPKDYAAAEDMASYAVDLAAAKASGVRLIVVREGAKPRREQWDPDGIEYSPSLVDAWMTAASDMPSERGNANRAIDIVQDCQGRVLVPVRMSTKT